LLNEVAATTGEPLDQIRQPTYRLCESLLELGLVDVATTADVNALTSR
jgi:hypothetical protein